MRWSAFPSAGARIRPEALIGLLLLAACVTVQEELDQAQISWQGAKYDEVVARWGPPARTATLPDGRRAHTWTSQETPVRGFGPSVGVGVYGGSGGGGGVGIGASFPFSMSGNPATCERTFTFQDNQIVEQSWTGDPSYCRYFKR